MAVNGGKSSLITVIIPIRNEKEEILIQLYKGLAKQSCKELWDVLIIDESDDSHFKKVLEIANLLHNNNVRIRIIHNKEPQGVGIAMLQGLLHASGMFVFFLDVDNILHQDFACRVINTIISETNTKDIAFISFLGTLKFKPTLSNRIFSSQDSISQRF